MTAPPTVTGVVSIRDVAAGSKSEQRTAVLTTNERSWLLRRPDGPSFGVDDELVAWEGQWVTVTGYAGSGVFLVVELVGVPDDPGKPDDG